MVTIANMHDRKAAYLLITEREFLINTKKNSNSRFILFVRISLQQDAQNTEAQIDPEPLEDVKLQ